MTFHQKVFAVLASLSIFVAIVSLVRNRKLQAEYSWLWIVTGFLLILMVIWYDLLVQLTALIGAVAPTTTLFVFGIVFLIFVSLHFSIKISQLSVQVKKLTQKISILEAEIDKTSR
jgi:hypothetical protein